MEQCLISVRDSAFEEFEIVVADDASLEADAVAQAARRFGARVVRLPVHRGPAAARNAAARVAQGEILVFLDADVTVHPDTLERIAAAFRADSTLDALLGSYDLCPQVTGRVARFRNLLHAHEHRRSAGSASTFWAGYGAVRRQRFEELGGFAETHRQPSIEDVEFGMRLHAAGGRLVLDPAVQVTHHKELTLAAMLQTDIFHRAIPWTELVIRHGWPRELNFRWRDRLSVIAAALFPLLAYLGVRYGLGWSLVAMGALAVLAMLQLSLFRFLARQRGAGFAVSCFPLYLAHLLASATGFVLGLARWEYSRDRRLPWVAAILAVLIFFAVQFAGGAYTAEFDGYADEAAHFMTGLMIRDFLAQWPAVNPLQWAEQYYLHYPKVAFMHWPPLFHVAEGVWWLFLPPSRVTAMLLIGLFGLAAALGFYRLAREISHPLAATAAACLLIATPVFQQSAAQNMAELATLLFEVLMIGALSRLAAPAAGVWTALILLVKGTGACLVPALLLLRVRRSFSILAAIFAMACAAAWFAWQSAAMGQISGWAGLDWSLPWSIPMLWKLAGPGVAVLAAGGLLTLFRTRQPVPAAAAAVFISIAGTSFFLRAMSEPRHWILALPPMLLLSLTCLASLRPPVVALAAAAALSLFPWSRYQQQPAGYARLADAVHQPARMMVSAAVGWQEGSWIVLASLRESRPSSIIVRATKVLARGSWSGTYYRLVADTPDAVETTLDRLGIETVIVDGRRLEATPLAHHQILLKTLATNSAWRQCAVSGQLAAWCRTQPSTVPREPLTIDLRRNTGLMIMEH